MALNNSGLPVAVPDLLSEGGVQVQTRKRSRRQSYLPVLLEEPADNISSDDESDSTVKDSKRDIISVQVAGDGDGDIQSAEQAADLSATLVATTENELTTVQSQLESLELKEQAAASVDELKNHRSISKNHAATDPAGNDGHGTANSEVEDKGESSTAEINRSKALSTGAMIIRHHQDMMKREYEEVMAGPTTNAVFEEKLAKFDSFWHAPPPALAPRVRAEAFGPMLRWQIATVGENPAALPGAMIDQLLDGIDARYHLAEEYGHTFFRTVLENLLVLCRTPGYPRLSLSMREVLRLFHFYVKGKAPAGCYNTFVFPVPDYFESAQDQAVTMTIRTFWYNNQLYFEDRQPGWLLGLLEEILDTAVEEADLLEFY